MVSDKNLYIVENNQFKPVVQYKITETANDLIKYCFYDNKSNTLVAINNNSITFITLMDENATANKDSVQLSNILVDGKSIALGNEISISANFEKIVIGFKAIGVSPFGSNQIFYQLGGYHNNFVLLTDSLSININKLRSGDYPLYVKSVDAKGNESKIQLITNLKVAPHFWQTNTFYGLEGIALASLAFGVVAYRNKNRRKTEARQQLLNQKITEERERISKDLHDHLGSSIITIIAQTDNIESKLRHNKITEALEKVQELSEQSRETINVLRETIWAVQEEQHTIKTFINRINIFLQRIFPQKNINWDFFTPR